MIRIIMVSLILCTLVFGYQPPPAPSLDPNDAPFIYDPNQCLSEPMIALIIRIGDTHNGEIEVTEPDGDPVTITLDVNNITVDTVPYYNEKDPNDPLGMARIYRYEWSWTPTVDDIGLHYVNVKVSDPYNAFNERTMIILVKENRPPVITGCR